MNSVLKYGLRFSVEKLMNSSKFWVRPALNSNVLKPNYSRTLWHMCSTSKIDNFLKPKPIIECCQCGCSGLIHTGGEKELAEFLIEEIAGEKKAQKMKVLPAEVDGFSIIADMAELIFEKKTQFETITVSMNVNHSVDTEEIGDSGSGAEEMKSKPSFEVEISRNKKALSFACSYVDLRDDHDAEGADIFQINEVTYFEGDWDDKTYSVAADLLDENLYDLFMVVLSEKGITKKFMEKVSDIATSHEHSQYIELLENVRKFASAN